jgi:AcrR family transcriptional regulator
MTTVTSAAPDRPLRADAARNRERILAAAAEVFADRGLEVSLDDIARHAGVGVGTVYRRFPTKESLVEALFEAHIARLEALAEKAVSYADSWDGLVAVLTEVCELQAGNRGFREILLSTTYGQQTAARARERLTPVIASALARAHAEGHLRAGLEPVDMVLVEFMVGAVADYTKHVPGAWRRYLEIVIDGLRARPDLAPPATPALSSDDLDLSMNRWRPHRR